MSLEVASDMKTTEEAFDGLLVLEYQLGNKKSLSILVKRYHLRLCKHSYRYTKDVEASRDIVQDSWSTIIGKLHALKNPNSFGSWAIKIVTRKSLDYLKRIKKDRAKMKEHYHDSKTFDGVCDNEAELKRLLEAIKDLPQNQQMVLRLFYLEEYSLKEIGDILNISVGTTKSRLFHAREKLKKIIKTRNHEKGH